MSSKSDAFLGSESDGDKLQFQNFNLTTSAVNSSTTGADPSHISIPIGGRMSGEVDSTQSPMMSATSGKDNSMVSNIYDDINQSAKTKHPFWSVAFYQEYFNVDTEEVGKRVFSSIIPTANFFDVIADNPDLYGPFWIATTVMAVAFVTNTIGKYIQDKSSNREFEYDTAKLSVVASIVYIYITLIPVVIWIVMRYFSFKQKLMDVISLYGYGMTIWIPLMMISIIGVGWVNFLLACIGFVFSVVFTIRNYFASTNTVVVFLVLASQFAYALIFYFVFTKVQ